MKRTINTIITTTIKTITTITFIMICAYLFGSINVSAAESLSEYDTIIDMTQVIDFTVNDDNLQLYFNDGTGYYWENGVDTDNEIVLQYIQNEYLQYDDDYIDMDTVIDFDATVYCLQLYFNDGSGYYWER